MADEISKAIIDTLIAEAGGQGEESMRRVAETILNRSSIRGLSPEQVVQQPYQYTGYSNPGPGAVRSQNNPAVRAIAEAAWRTAQQPGDPTGGADHYYAPGTISQPSWARGMTPTGQFGGHNYYSSRPIPPGEIPNTVASALSVTQPRVAPNPITQSPDLAQMRNPIMSSSARNAQATPYPAPPRGMISPGNINPNNRPVVQNEDGTISTVRTISANLDGPEVLMPTVSPDGRIWTDDQAIDNYIRTGQNFGQFTTPDAATQFAQRLHTTQEGQYASPSNNTPLPRPRPSAPDIVTPTMASLNAQRPNVNASRAGDMLAASKTPYTPRLTDAGDNIYSYHIPDMTPTAIVGGIGSLTPNPARQRLPDIPRTIPGQSQIERAAANVRPAAPAASPSAVAPAQNMLSRDSVANAALGQRVATQMGQAFNPPENAPTRLVPKPIVQPTNVTRNQPPIQVVPAPQPQIRSAPVPALMSQGLAAQRMPIMASQQMGGGLPLMRSQPVSQAPLRVTVSGANSYSSPAATPVQSLQRQGLSDADAYALANQQSRERAYERVNGPDTRSDWFRDVTGG